MDYLDYQLLPSQLQYKIEEQIHQGTYYNIYKATHKTTKQLVAIKIAKFIYRNILHSKSIYKDVFFQKQLNHPNIAKIYEVYYETDSNLPSSKDCLYIVMEYLPFNLNYIIKSQYLLPFDLLSALKHIHSRDLLHMNLQPNHILMDKDLIMKISGFTDANTINYKGILEETHKTFRFYRAPEVILLSKISIKSDIWQFGCIFGELASLQDEKIIQGPLFVSDSCFPMSPREKIISRQMLRKESENKIQELKQENQFFLSENDLLIKQLTFCKDQEYISDFDLDQYAINYLEQCREVVKQKNYQNSLTEKVRQMSQYKQSFYIMCQCLRFNPHQRIDWQGLSELFSLQQENEEQKIELNGFELVDQIDLKQLFLKL